MDASCILVVYYADLSVLETMITGRVEYTEHFQTGSEAGVSHFTCEMSWQ